VWRVGAWVVGLQDMMMTNKDYEMKLMKNEELIGCGLVSYEWLSAVCGRL
jgi:hypothetical protein